MQSLSTSRFGPAYGRLRERLKAARIEAGLMSFKRLCSLDWFQVTSRETLLRQGLGDFIQFGVTCDSGDLCQASSICWPVDSKQRLKVW